MPNLYVDLSWMQGQYDTSRSYVKQSMGPNTYWYGHSSTDGRYTSATYYYTGPNGVTDQISAMTSSGVVTPVIPLGTRIEKGINFSWQTWGDTSSGTFQPQQLFGGTGITGFQILAQPATYTSPTGTIATQKFSDANYTASISYFNWSTQSTQILSLKQAADWVTISDNSLWVQNGVNSGYNLTSQYPGAQLQARTVTDSVSGLSAVQVRYGTFTGGAFTSANLSASEWAAVFDRFRVIDTNSTTPHQSTYQFKVQITEAGMGAPPAVTSTSWVGSAGVATNADTAYVTYDSLAPSPKAVYAAGTALILSMNGTGSSNFDGSNVAESTYAPVSDQALINTFTITYRALNSTADVNVDVVSIKSGYGAYLIETRSPLPKDAVVSLRYTPPAGTVGIDQISGVIQDQAMNDAQAFTMNTTTTANTGVLFEAATAGANQSVNNLDGFEIGSANSIVVTPSGAAFVLTATWKSSTGAVDKTAVANVSLKSGQSVSGVTLTSSTAFSEWVSANAGKFDSIDKVTMTQGGVTVTETIPKAAGRAMADDTLDGVEFSWDDTLIGGAGNDKLSGLTGNDSLKGNAGNDTLDGGSGDDVLSGGVGNNLLIGGQGFDTADYSDLNTAINVDLTRSSYQVTDRSSPSPLGPVSDTLSGIERVVGSKQADWMQGDGGNNVLNGGGGADTLAGGAGDDRYYVDNALDVIEENFSGPQDQFTMGGFNDHVIASVSYALASNVYVEDMYAAGTLTGATGADAAINLTGNDLGQGIIGNDAVNILRGGAGSDGIFGGGGNDTLLGGGGDDFLLGGTGNDSIDGGDGNDTAFAFVNGPVFGTNNFNNQPFWLNATGGVDTIDGGSGNDTLIFDGNQSDYAFRLDGDWVVGTRTQTGESVRFRNFESLSFGVVEKNRGDDTLKQLTPSVVSTSSLDVRNQVLGTAGNDTLNGTANDDVLLGLDGNDLLQGSAGSDKLFGGAGADTLDGGSGSDVLLGGVGNDLYRVDALSDQVEELSGEGIDEVQLTSLMSYTLSANVENLTTAFAGPLLNPVTLTGNAGNNILKSTAPAGTYTTFIGGGGHDTFIGGSGDDTYVIDLAQSGNVVISDSGGADTIQFVNANNDNNYTTASVDVTNSYLTLSIYSDESQRSLLRTITVQNAATPAGIGAGAIESIKQAFGRDYRGSIAIGATATTPNGVDTLLVGTSAAQTFTAGTGSDLIMGGAGNDTFLAGAGRDIYDGGAGSDYVTYGGYDANNPSRTNGVFVWGIFDHTTPQNLNQDYLVYKGTVEGIDVRNGVVDFSQVPGYNTYNNSPGIPPAMDVLLSMEAVRGTQYNDTFIGSTASDFFAGNGGNNFISGGSGFDWADYKGLGSTTAGGVRVNLRVGTVSGSGDFTTSSGAFESGNVLQNLVNNGQLQPYFNNKGDIWGTATGWGGGDKLVGIEGIRGTDFADTLIGSSAGNMLRGGLGDDLLVGGSSGLPGWLGLNSGDFADYAQAGSAVTVNLGVGTNAATLLTVGQVSALNSMGVTSLNGLSYGTASGGDGNDVLVGFRGVRGSAFADTLIGGAMPLEVFYGGEGNDTIVGGSASADLVSYKWATGGVTVTLGLAAPTNVTTVGGVNVKGMTYGTSSGADGTDTLYGIGNMEGSRFADNLKGDDRDNVFRPLDGADTIDGGAGSDTVDYRDAMRVANQSTNNVNIFDFTYKAGQLLKAPGVLVNLSGPYDSAGYISVTVADGLETTWGASTDKIRNIENIIGSLYDDTLVGDAGANTFAGMAGDDLIIGGGGFGDAVSYQRAYGGVTVVLDGGSDASTRISSSVTSALGVNLSNVSWGTSFGADGSDVLVGIQKIRGSEFSDTISGDGRNNTIEGGQGDDTLYGGQGVDTVSYRNAAGSVTINMQSGQATGAAGTDSFSGFEVAEGSDFGNTMHASNDGNTLIGGLGNDSFYGGSGNDLMRGLSGSDFYSGGAGSDTVSLSGSFSDYSFRFTPAANGDPGMITLTSTSSSAPAQVAQISGDVEFIKFDANPNVVIDTTLSLSRSTPIFVGEGGQPGEVTPIGTVIVTGTDANDFLSGTSLTGQTLIGGKGDDFLDGGTGRDVLMGGVGNDTYVARTGDRILEDANAGKDTAVAAFSYVLGANVENLTLQKATNSTSTSMMGLGNHLDNVVMGANNVRNVLYGRDGHDTLMGGNQSDTLSGGNGNDVIYGSSQWSLQNGVVTFTDQSTAADLLTGGAGNDTLYGARGNDFIDGGVGADMLYGGLGDDVYNVTDKAAVVVERAGEGNDMVLSGLASYTLTDNVETLLIANAVVGGSGMGNALNNTLIGNLGDNTLDAGWGNDLIVGDGSLSTLGTVFDPNVQGGNDILIGGGGNDTIMGQYGDDVLIAGQVARDANGALVKDTAFNYVVTGIAGSSDVLYGGAGNDIYYVTSTDDVAWDVQLGLNAQGGVSPNLASDAGGVDWVFGTVEIELNRSNHFLNIENAKLLDHAPSGVTDGNYLGLSGTATSNTLIGNQHDNWIQGFAGNDTLQGNGGNDYMVGGVGDDYIDGGSGRSEFNGASYGTNERGHGNDDRWGTQADLNAFNLLNPSFSPQVAGRQQGVRVNLDTTTQLGLAAGKATGYQGTDTLVNIHGVVGSDYDDILVGNASDNFFAGGLGNDTIVGGAGKDVLQLGANSAYGMTIDMTALGLNLSAIQTQATARALDLSKLSTAQNQYFDANVPEASRLANNGLGTLTFWGFEALGASELADTITGTADADIILGLNGSDLILGGDGNDSLYGNSFFASGLLAGGGPERDILRGGNGSDLVWSGLGGSSLFGDAGNDTLVGLQEDDYLNGGSGDDSLSAGAGNDTLFGGGGTDVLQGGLGNDLYIYIGVTSRIIEGLNEGTDMVFVTGVTGYTLDLNIENAALAPMSKVFGASLNGAANAPTLLTGNASNNLLLGNDSANTLIGGDGADTLFGYGGDDVLTGGAGNDVFGLSLDMTGGRLKPSDERDFGGVISDFNKAGSDKLLLNFVAKREVSTVNADQSTTTSTVSEGYAYKLNVGTTTSYLGGANAQGPEATISYDASSGLLQVEFEHWDATSGNWVYDNGSQTATGNAHLTYYVMGAYDPTSTAATANVAAVLNESSFLIDHGLQPVHPGVTLTTL